MVKKCHEYWRSELHNTDATVRTGFRRASFVNLMTILGILVFQRNGFVAVAVSDLKQNHYRHKLSNITKKTSELVWERNQM